MKKSMKVLFATVVLSIAFVTPVFATESALSAESAMLAGKVNGFENDLKTLVQYDNLCPASDIASMNDLADRISADVEKSNIAEENNYIAYLNAVVGNALETERVKKQNVAALTTVVNSNPTLRPQLEAAVAEYNKAVADRQAAEKAVVDAKAYFAQLNQKFVDEHIAKASADAQAVIGNVYSVK